MLKGFPDVVSLTGSTTFWMLLVLLLAVLSVNFASHLFKQRRLRKLGGKLSYVVPSRLPFGLDLAFRNIREILNDHYYEYTREILKRPGRTIEFHMLDKRMIMTDNEENIKAMFSTQFNEFGKGKLTHKIFKNLFEGSIFGSDGHEWAAHRKSLRPHIAMGRPTDDAVIEKHFQRLLNQIPNGGSVEIYDLLDRHLLNAVTEVFVDPDIDPESLPTEPFVNGVNSLLKFNTLRVCLGRTSLIFPDTWYARNSTKKLYAYLDNHVERIRRIQNSDDKGKPEEEWTVMDRFANDCVDAKAYRSRFISLLSASKDPIGMIVVWILYEVARNPQMAVKLRSEIVSTIGPGEILPDSKQLRSMQYLQNLIREAMRMYHPFGFNVRCPSIDTTLPTGGGPNGEDPVPVLAETMIVANILSLQRRTDLVGPDSDTFNPERWEPNTPTSYKPTPWQYLPFNRGPRNCLGQKFGEFTMAYLLVRFFQTFERIEPAPGAKVQRIRVEMNTKVSEAVDLRFWHIG